MIRIWILAFCCLLNSTSLAEAFDDTSFCKQMESLEQKNEKDIGKMLDKYTRNDGIAVLCGNKAIDFKKFIYLNEADMRPGWKERKAAQWNQIYCEGEVLEAINNGWTIALTIITHDGKRFWHKATCPTKS